MLSSERAVRRLRVLTVAGTYVPSLVGGGHIRSIQALTEHLAAEIDFYIVCRDRDSSGGQPYEGIQPRKWEAVGYAQVWYEPKGRFGLRLYRRLLADLAPDAVYLNTLFSVREGLVPAAAVCLWRREARLVVAPRGSFDPNALALKQAKKAMFLRVFRWARLARAMTFQASSAREAADIRRSLGHVPVVVTGHLPRVSPVGCQPRSAKHSGTLNVVFLARIVPIKNLQFLVERLARVRGRLRLTLAGPVEDREYWVGCSKALERLAHVEVVLLGSVPHERVPEVLAQHDALVLPSLGENFCHAVAESLSVGTPVVVSDRTPWRHLDGFGVGWDLPLEDPRAWESCLQRLCDMGEAEHRLMRRSAAEAVSRLIDIPACRKRHLALFAAQSPT